MPPKISTIVFKVYTPTKHKFKPLRDQNPTPEPLDASDDKDVDSECSGIHSQDDSEWPPLSPSSSTKPVVAQIWPKSLSSSAIEDHEIPNQEKYASTTTN
jgi:hypothetical protein